MRRWASQVIESVNEAPEENVAAERQARAKASPRLTGSKCTPLARGQGQDGLVAEGGEIVQSRTAARDERQHDSDSWNLRDSQETCRAIAGGSVEGVIDVRW